MDAVMESFWDELEAEEVHIRDKWQFELKSEFFTNKKKAQYIQEFYLFVPNSLQINSGNYSKAQFYLDQTNLIRYKTPEFQLKELVDVTCPSSPLTAILFLSEKEENETYCKELSYQLKLLGNVLRSSMRMEVKNLLKQLKRKTDTEKFNNEIERLCHNLSLLRTKFRSAQTKIITAWKSREMREQLEYLDKFIAFVLQSYLSGILESIRLQNSKGQFDKSDQALCSVLLEEGKIISFLATSQEEKERYPEVMEKILYMRGLLNKFVLDALLLTINRQSLDQRYYHWISAISAGVAMMIFVSLYVWLGNVFVINSLPFIALTVLIYILKDRIKEGLRFLSFRHASKWFPDFTTEILSPERKRFGRLKETFFFINPKKLPEEVLKIRNQEFHQMLETFQRPETVLCYKRIIEVSNPLLNGSNLAKGINIISRFNIFRFLRKAGDPFEKHLVMDPETKKMERVNLPKVYHLNLIIRSSSNAEDKPGKVEIKKLRIVLDKNGIKRIEQVGWQDPVTY